MLLDDRYREALTEQVVYELTTRRSEWSAMIVRRQQIAALIANRWQMVWPDELETGDLPAVANIFRTTTEDLGRLFSEQIPSERVYSDGGGAKSEPTAEDVDKADKLAERREQAIMGYTATSQINDVLEYIGMDMVAAGYAAVKVWPDLSLPRDERVPTFRRLHPSTTLPETSWAPHKPTDNVIVSYVESVARLKAQAPAAAQALFDKIGQSRIDALRNGGYDLSVLGKNPTPMAPTLEMVEWYSSMVVARVACWTDPNYPDERYGVLVEAVANPTRACPVQLAPRPTWALEPLGQLDDSKGIILTKNRYFSILLDYFIRMTYGGKLAWNVKNPTEIGPDSIYYALGPDAKMESVTPQIPSFQALNVIGMLESEGRSTATAPASREGEVDLNKASAAFLAKAQGQYNSVVRSLDRQWAITKRRCNEIAAEMDEVWCDWRKTLKGRARGKRYAMSYVPSELWKGDYANAVTYGTASGLDKPTDNVIRLQKRQTGVMSVETFLETDPDNEDVALEIARLNGDRVNDAALAMLLEPGVDQMSRVRAMRAFQQGKSVADVIEALAQAPPAPGTALSGTGVPVIPSGPSGVPGAAAPSQPTPLPPLGVLRQAGPPQRQAAAARR